MNEVSAIHFRFLLCQDARVPCGIVFPVIPVGPQPYRRQNPSKNLLKAVAKCGTRGDQIALLCHPIETITQVITLSSFNAIFSSRLVSIMSYRDFSNRHHPGVRNFLQQVF